MKFLQLVAVAASLAFLSACSGGGSRTTPQPPVGTITNPTSGSNVPTVMVRLAFSIPARAPSAADQRRPAFVARTIQSAILTAYQPTAAAYRGNDAATNIVSSYIDLSTGSPNCAANPDGSRSCSVFLPAPVTPSCTSGPGADGCDFFEIDTYNAAPSTNDPSGHCGGGTLQACTGTNGIELSTGTDGNGASDNGYNVVAGSSISVSLGLQGIFNGVYAFHLTAPATYPVGNNFFNYPAPFASNPVPILAIGALAGIGPNPSAVLESLPGSPYVVDADSNTITGGGCTNGDLFDDGIVTNAVTSGGLWYGVDGAGGVRQAQLMLKPCGSGSFQPNPVQGINAYFINDQIQAQYLGGGGAGNEETATAPYFAWIQGSGTTVYGAPSAALANNWFSPPATGTNTAYSHPYPLNPAPGCGPGSTFCVFQPQFPLLAQVTVAVAPLFAQTFSGNAGSNENDSAAGGPNAGHAVLTLSAGSSGRIYADQIIPPTSAANGQDFGPTFGAGYAATPSAGCSGTVNGTSQVAVSLTGPTVLLGTDGSPAITGTSGFGARWIATAGNLPSPRAGGTLGNPTTSCVITLSDSVNSVAVWISNSVAGGTIGIPASQQLFVSNLGNNTVTIYTDNIQLATASPTVISNGVSQAYSLGMDSAGNLFVANSGNNTVTIYPAGNYTAAPTVISNGLNGPGSIALDSSGNLFAANGGNDTVTRYPVGNYTTASPTVISNGVSKPLSVAVDSAGDLFVANCGSYCGGVPPAGTVTEYTAGNYSAAPIVITNGTNTPNKLAFDAVGDLFVTNDGNSVTEYPAGNFTGAPTVISAGMNYPFAVAFAANGDLFVPQVNGSYVTRYPFGNYTTGSPSVISNGINRPLAVAFDSAQNLFVINQGQNSMPVYAPPYSGAPVFITNGISNPAALLIR